LGSKPCAKVFFVNIVLLFSTPGSPADCLGYYTEMPGRFAAAPPLHVRYDSRPQRIQVEITEQFEKILLRLTNHRVEPVLKYVTSSSVPPVETPRISAHENPHVPGQRKRSCLYQKMKVIRDQRPRIHFPGFRIRKIGHTPQKILTIIVVPKDTLTTKPPGHHMVQ
jgi:hypothetical protein